MGRHERETVFFSEKSGKYSEMTLPCDTMFNPIKTAP